MERMDVPSQRALHLGRPGSWWAIYVAWPVWLLVAACACGGTLQTQIPLPSPGQLASPPCRVGGYMRRTVGDSLVASLYDVAHVDWTRRWVRKSDRGGAIMSWELLEMVDGQGHGGLAEKEGNVHPPSLTQVDLSATTAGHGVHIATSQFRSTCKQPSSSLPIRSRTRHVIDNYTDPAMGARPQLDARKV
jgi:hypothetical protein